LKVIKKYYANKFKYFIALPNWALLKSHPWKNTYFFLPVGNLLVWAPLSMWRGAGGEAGEAVRRIFSFSNFLFLFVFVFSLNLFAIEKTPLEKFLFF
jgi:hypothetical protein